MSFTLQNFFALLVAYLLGSIPTAVWIGKLFYGTDVREHGSKNAGATNTFRILGAKAGIPVLVIDMLKGWLAVKFFYFFGENFTTPEQVINFRLALGIMAMIGHIFPLFAGFKGGKGIATLVGFMVGIHPEATLVCIGIFVAILLATRYVSLGSIIAAVSFPLVIIFLFHETVPSLLAFSVCITFIVLLTHRNNIKRLIKREEMKIYLTKR